MIKIGIECESIEESQSWGVAREVNNLLRQIAARPELEKEFRFFLYFKSKIPDYDFLKSPIFVKKIIWSPIGSFSLYYYLFLPIKLWFGKLDMVYFPNYMLPILFRGKSLVSLTEDVFYEIKNNDLPFRYRLAYGIFSNWAAKHATRINTFSESSKKAVSELFNISPERIIVNYHGVEIKKSQQSLKLDFNFGLYVGQAFPRRHLRETLLAFEKIAPKYPDLKFIAVGKDRYNAPVVFNLIKDINFKLGSTRAILKEYVSEQELISLMENAKFLTYVSSREAFGLPPLEGLGYGTIPIVADVPVNREIYGENAFFVTGPITVDSIAKAMDEVLNNQVKVKAIKSSAPDVVKRFNWQIHAEKFLKVIREVISL